MLFKNRVAAKRAAARSTAIDRSQAVIEFDMQGVILTANKNFLDAMGYELAEIEGKHHRIFVETQEAASEAYDKFWKALRNGEFQAAEYRRIGKGGRKVWIQASYNPTLDDRGKPVSVVKFATDITAAKMRSLEDKGKIAAIDRAQAVIEFDLDGNIMTANDNFLAAVGYTLVEVKGRHHSMFVDPAERASAAYIEFWKKLRRGEYESAEFKRFGKDGREIWILASYNPIMDEGGKPFKVVKFATDITQEKLRAADMTGQIAAISKSQAVIEFDMAGMILSANENFLSAVGYSISDIKGKHHSMFVDAAERRSPQYAEFWADLKRGKFQSGEYQRIGKGGKTIWIQASYNPIADLNGVPFKVVKYATDTTGQVIARKRSEHVGRMVESVASGAEKLNVSVREIADAMLKSRQTASEAVTKVDLADSQAHRLTSAAEAMSGIVELIGNITGQINLLALNATIESARAGEAGRGFAVVAAEVKNLANQAKAATEKIGDEIANLNGISGDVVGALEDIKRSIQSVNDYVSSTSEAVEQQSLVTTEMSQGMQRAAEEASAMG